jgi:hypothetical protein
MTTTWIEVVDTAVKIGLGAVITGAATYFVAQLNHKNGIAKDFISKKVSILEEISELTEEYFYFCTRLNNRVGGILKNATNAGMELTAAQKKRIQEVNKDINQALEKRNKALSKIHLLKIEAAITAIMEFNNVLSEYRDIVVFNNRLPTEQERDELAVRLNLNKKAFYQATSNYLSSLG